MRYALISDIHGNLEALEAVLEDIVNRQVDRVLHLGDLINYGPEPDRCVDRIVDLGINGVAGNHELALADRMSANMLNATAADSLSVTARMLENHHLDYLKELPLSMEYDGFLLVHGVPPDSVEEYISHHDYDSRIYGLDEVFMKMDRAIAFVGHTHLLGVYSRDEEFKKKLNYGEVLSLDNDSAHIVNVGSVGQPRDGNPDARYVIFDSGRMTVEAGFVSYPVTTTVEKIFRSGLPDINGERLLRGM
jgi:predicted phosphodiesterase